MGRIIKANNYEVEKTIEHRVNLSKLEITDLRDCLNKILDESSKDFNEQNGNEMYVMIELEEDNNLTIALDDFE